MRDFPMFTTEYGVASLVLREIPYRQEAYITVLSSEDPEELLRECASFCRMAGAEKIYARGHSFLEAYPVHCKILEMRGVARVEESKVRCLWPVTEETVTKWRELMNARLFGVDNAATLDRSKEKEILASGGAYYVHDGTSLLGAGWLADGELKLLAAAQKGAGETVMQTLLSLVVDQPLLIRVASTNDKALRLYERMGFTVIAEVTCWYCIS